MKKTYYYIIYTLSIFDGAPKLGRWAWMKKGDTYRFSQSGYMSPNRASSRFLEPNPGGDRWPTEQSARIREVQRARKEAHLVIK
jgi:hypothetical protein